MIHPDLPSLRVSENNLKDINFPLSFRICITEIENSTKRYENVGYEGEFAFFSGKRMYEPKNLYGFAGHTSNGSTLSDVQGWYLFIQYLHYLMICHLEILRNVSLDWKNILRSIRIISNDDQKKTQKIKSRDME